jgi:hypothetical protein
VVGAQEVPGGRVDVEGQHDVEPAPGDPVEQAARVGDERPEHPGGAVDRRRVAVEGVLVGDAGHRVAGRVVHAQHVVDRLQHEAVAHTQALVGRFQRELVAAVGGALVAVVQAVDAADQLRARRHLAGGHGGTGVAAQPAREAPVDGHALAGGGHPRGDLVGVGLLTGPDLGLLEGPAADRAASDRGRPTTWDLPGDGVRARRRDPRAHHQQRRADQDWHQRPGQQAPAVHGLSVRCSCGRRCVPHGVATNGKGRRSASWASLPRLGHAASFADRRRPPRRPATTNAEDPDDQPGSY